MDFDDYEPNFEADNYDYGLYDDNFGEEEPAPVLETTPPLEIQICDIQPSTSNATIVNSQGSVEKVRLSIILLIT